MLFILRFFFDLVISFIYVDMCMCELDHRYRPPHGAWWKQFLWQTGITVSCIQHIIQVYLKKNTIRIIITRIYNFFQSLNVID